MEQYGRREQRSRKRPMNCPRTGRWKGVLKVKYRVLWETGVGEKEDRG